jgi:hypothetical protein
MRYPSLKKKASQISRKANVTEEPAKAPCTRYSMLASVSVQLSGSKRYKVLRPRTHIVDFLDQVSQILAALNEINF